MHGIKMIMVSQTTWKMIDKKGVLIIMKSMKSMKKKVIIAGATGALCGFLYTAVKKNKAKNVDDKKENMDNMIVVGASGSGKTQDIIKHALLQNTGSIIVNDEDFTLYKQTQDILQKKGYQIKKLDLCKPQDSCTYNPLMYAKTERDVLTVANFILNSTIDKNATGTVEFEEAKQLLLLTCIYYVLENETDKTLLQVKDILECFLKMDKMPDKPGFSAGLTAEYYERFLDLDENLRYGVIHSTYFHLFSFLSPKTSRIVCSDDIHLDKFMEEKTVLFVNPNKIDASSKTTDLSGLLYYQMCSIAENNAINHIPFTYRVSLLIDDITCYEDIPCFAYWIGYGKSYGISIIATLQSLEQLNCVYEETCISILEHIDKLVFLSDDFLLCFDKQLSKYLELKYGNDFLSELGDMKREEIMVCITDKAYKILQRKETLWQ